MIKFEKRYFFCRELFNPTFTFLLPRTVCLFAAPHCSITVVIITIFIGEANALYWKSFERQNSTHLALLKHQNTKTGLYKLPKNHWVIALFEISGPVRNKSLVTVSLDHPVSSDSDTKYFLSHDSNVMSYHQWKTFQVVVTDDVYPPTAFVGVTTPEAVRQW